jgi:outer membrane usher protein
VVRDILGREQIIIQPYYVAPSLLKQGLQDYSYELGFLRRKFGTKSNNYGQPLAVVTHRQGINKQLTGEFHGELLGHQQTIGLGGVLLAPDVGVFSGSLAMSHSRKGVGGLLKFGIHHKNRLFSFGANTQLASQRFAKLGMLPKELAPSQISRIFANLSSKSLGNFSVNYMQQYLRNQNENKILGARYTRKVGSKGNLSLSMNRFLSGDAKTAFYLNLSMTLGNRTQTNISTSTQSGHQQASLRVSRKRPEGSGIGYGLTVGLGELDPHEVKLSTQNKVGTHTLIAKQSQGQTELRGNASGSVAFLGGGAFLGRHISDSFAVVQVPGYSGVSIYSDNQFLGRTDNNGNVVVPGLRSYQRNSVRIEQDDLPFDTQIDAVQMDAVPHFRSGLLLKFPVKSLRGALLTVVLKNGEPLPAGAQVQIIGDNIVENELFPSGYRGEVYLTGLAASNRLIVTLEEQSCEFMVLLPETTEPLPYLGTYTCIGIAP